MDNSAGQFTFWLPTTEKTTTVEQNFSLPLELHLGEVAGLKNAFLQETQDGQVAQDSPGTLMQQGHYHC